MYDSSSATADTAKSKDSVETAGDNNQDDFPTVISSSSPPPPRSSVAASGTTTTTGSSSQKHRPSHPPPRRLVLEPTAATSTSTATATANDRQHRKQLPRGTVYMLHGWAQNVHVFSHRSRKLTKRLVAAGYRVVFLQGPHKLPPRAPPPPPPSTGSGTEPGAPGPAPGVSVPSREHAYAWFLYNETDDTGADRHLRPSETGTFPGMDRSLEYVRKELEADRNVWRDCNYDCGARGSDNATIPPAFVLGFSQGAVLVHKIATLACGRCDGDCGGSGNDDGDFNGDVDSNPVWSDVRKCVLVSGFSFTASLGRPSPSTTIRGTTADHDDKRCSDRQARGDGDGDGDGIFPRDRRTAIRATVPSFHVVGTNDSRVPPHLTRELYSLEPCFGNNGGGDRCHRHRGNAQDADADADADASSRSSRETPNIGEHDASRSSLPLGSSSFSRNRHEKVLWEHDRGHVLPQDLAFCHRLLQFLAAEA
eukprot:jgi/Psemu1/290620/fgenesh1_pg.528_\